MRAELETFEKKVVFSEEKRGMVMNLKYQGLEAIHTTKLLCEFFMRNELKTADCCPLEHNLVEDPCILHLLN